MEICERLDELRPNHSPIQPSGNHKIQNCLWTRKEFSADNLYRRSRNN